MNIDRKLQGHVSQGHTQFVKDHTKHKMGGFYTVPLKELHIPPFWAKMRYMF